MAQDYRASGRSPVPLIIFIVLWLGATIAFIVAMVELSAKDREINYRYVSVENDPTVRLLELEDMGYRAYILQLDAIRRQKIAEVDGLEQIMGLSNLDELQDTFPRLLARVRAIQDDTTDIGEPSSLIDLFRALESQVQQLSSERDRLETKLTTTTKQLDDTREQATRETGELNSTIDARNRTIAQLKDANDQLEDRIREDVAKLNTEIQALRNDHMNDLRTKDLELAEARKRTVVLQERLDEILGKGGKVPIEGADDVDGKVLSSAHEAGFVVIGLGRTDGMLRGMSFVVYSAGVRPKDNPEKVKGKIEVKKVFADVSYAAIVDQEKYDPIVAGDQLVNPAYQAGRGKVFVLQGGFAKLSSDGMRDLLMKYGHTVKEGVDWQTDYLVVGTGEVDPDNDPMVQQARDHGVVILKEDSFWHLFDE